jgi:hypothetical protein
MPRAGEPRVTVRLGEVDYAVLKATADAAGVALGALIREAAVRYAREIATPPRTGARPKMRRAASTPLDPRRDKVAVALEAREASEGRGVVPAAGADRAEMFRRMTARRS